MKYRSQELYHEQTLDDTGTKIIDINFRDPLSALTLQFAGNGGGTSNKKNWMSDVVTKIEIVDGSDVLISLTLKQLQALQAYHTGIMPYVNVEEMAASTQRDEATIYFGRYLWDPLYYLDLTKFTNPQLKITTDEDIIRAMSATGFLTGSFKVSIVAHIIQEGAEAAPGFIMQKEIYNFTAATSGDEHVDLPIDHPYVGLMINSTIRGSDINEIISQWKLSCDSDKFVVFDRYVKDNQHEQEHEYQPFSCRMIYFAKNGETLNFPIYYNPRITLHPTGAGVSAAFSWMWSGNAALQLHDAAGAAVTSEQNLWAIIQGSSPHCSVFHRFGVRDNPATYFNPKDWNEVKLILTQAGAAATKVCLQQLRSLT